ncbi:MAG: Hpt domain-containing protein [Planctomycetota bacterium]
MTATGESNPFALNRDELTDRMMGSVDIAQRMLRQFLDSSQAELDVLESTIRIGDADAIASLVHRHKGTAKTLAAPQIAALSSMMEKQARNGMVSDLLGILEDLRLAHVDLEQAVQAWVSESSDGVIA